MPLDGTKGHQVYEYVFDNRLFNVDQDEWLSQNYPEINSTERMSRSGTGVGIGRDSDKIKARLAKITVDRKTKRFPTNQSLENRQAIEAVENKRKPVSHINLGGIGIIINFGETEEDIRGVVWNYGWSSFKHDSLRTRGNTTISSWTQFEEFINQGGDYKVLMQHEYSLQDLAITEEILDDIVRRRKLGRAVSRNLANYSAERAKILHNLSALEGDVDNEDLSALETIISHRGNLTAQEMRDVVAIFQGEPALRQAIRALILQNQNSQQGNTP